MIPLLLALSVFQVSGSATDRNFGHERVVANIEQNYGDSQRLVRPSTNTSVAVGIALHVINSFDEQTGELQAGYWIRQSWKDVRLSWEDASVLDVRFPIDLIWRPDLRVWNSAGAKDTTESTLPILYRDGSVLWVPPADYTTRCERPEEGDTDWSCLVKVGSWTQNGWEIKLSFYQNQTKLDLMAYKPNLFGWEVIPEDSEIVDQQYDCCSAPYSSADFKFKVRKIKGGVADISAGAKASWSITCLLSAVILKICS